MNASCGKNERRARTSLESVEPLPVDSMIVVGKAMCLGRQPNRVAHQLVDRVVLNVRPQTGRLSTVEDDRLREVALAQTVC